MVKAAAVILLTAIMVAVAVGVAMVVRGKGTNMGNRDTDITAETVRTMVAAGVLMLLLGVAVVAIMVIMG